LGQPGPHRKSSQLLAPLTDRRFHLNNASGAPSVWRSGHAGQPADCPGQKDGTLPFELCQHTGRALSRLGIVGWTTGAARVTPSTLHRRETGCCVFSASISRNLIAADRSPWRRKTAQARERGWVMLAGSKVSRTASKSLEPSSSELPFLIDRKSVRSAGFSSTEESSNRSFR